MSENLPQKYESPATLPQRYRPRPDFSLSQVAARFETDTVRMEPQAWLKIAVLGALFIVVNSWQFLYLYQKCRHDPNWAHGFLIPLFSAYLLYNRRAELLGARRQTNYWGLGIMVSGLLMTMLGFYPIRNSYFAELAMLMTLFGLVLYLMGPKVMKVAWAPILYLVLGLPIPDAIYNQIALPLQMLAAKMSGALLTMFGATITVTALNLDITGHSGREYPVMVAEACSGIRSMMAFVALSVAMAYIEDKPRWQRAVMVLMGVPIAIICNILRVTLTGTMYVWDQPEFGSGLMHEFMGMALLVPAFFLLLGLGKVLQTLFVEEQEEDEQGYRPPPWHRENG